MGWFVGSCVCKWGGGREQCGVSGVVWYALHSTLDTWYAPYGMARG